jgi:hypothetical protein
MGFGASNANGLSNGKSIDFGTITKSINTCDHSSYCFANNQSKG